MRLLLATMAVLLAVSLVGCGDTEADSGPPEISDSISDSMMDGSFVLADSDIDKYLKIMKEMQTAGDSMDGNSSMMDAFSANSDMRSLLKKHGVATPEFARIQAAITAAMGAVMMKNTAPLGDNSALLKNLENTPGMTPEKLADIRGKMKETSKKANAAFAAVPESNINLIESRMNDLKNLGR